MMTIMLVVAAYVLGGLSFYGTTKAIKATQLRVKIDSDDIESVKKGVYENRLRLQSTTKG